jgi:AAA15 family ATPase/GTPase
MLNYLFNGFSNQNYLRVHSNIAEYELLLKDAHEMPPEVLENYISGYQAATKLVKKLVEAFYEEQKEKDEKFLEILEQMASRLLIPRFVLMTSEGKIVMIIIESTYKEVVEYKIFFPPFEQTGEHANVVLIDEYLTRGYLGSTTDFSTILKNLDRTFKPKLESVKEFLGRQFPIEIQDIVSTLSDFYVITEDKIAIPISLVGDGTKTSLIYFYVLSSEGNYILLEEPENHLHPRLMKNVIDIILEASKHNNQIFITTHSLEFLENLLEMAAQKGANLMTFRFEKLDNGIPVIESYDLTEANKAVNKIGVDIR